MPRGGKREGAGRPLGAGTKKKRNSAKRAAAEGLSPIDYLLSVMREMRMPRSPPASTPPKQPLLTFILGSPRSLTLAKTVVRLLSPTFAA